MRSIRLSLFASGFGVSFNVNDGETVAVFMGVSPRVTLCPIKSLPF